MANNIFDTRNIIKETPKTGNRFLLSPDSGTLHTIVTASPLYKLFCKNAGEGAIAQALGGLMGAAAVSTGAFQTVLNLSLLSCTIPSFEFETGELNHFNDSVKHLSKFSTTNDMSAVFYDYINGSATAIMLAWQSAVGFKLTGQLGYKEDYVCDMDLHLYGPNRPGYIPNGTSSDNRNDSVESGSLMQYKILNAWPRSVDIGEFSYDGAEIKKVTVQFSYDIIVPFMVKGDSDAGDGLSLKSFTYVNVQPTTVANAATNVTTTATTTNINTPGAGLTSANQTLFQGSTNEDLDAVMF